MLQYNGRIMSEQKVVKKRAIRSYVLRSGRMTPSQRLAYKEQWESAGLEVVDGVLDYDRVFRRSAPRVLEIGFGMGDSLAEMAEASPEKDFVGVEVHRPGVGRILHLMSERHLTNVRVYCHDAVEVLNRCVANDSLDRLQLFFPDPWHKKRHHKRRIVQPEFIALVCSKLKIGGRFHAATDWENYAGHMMEVLSAAQGMENAAGAGQFAPKPDYRPSTKFEKRGERLGHGVWDLIFTRVGS